jgi:hypothetical protein
LKPDPTDEKDELEAKKKKQSESEENCVGSPEN